MYPDSKYAIPIGSFQFPVPLPGVEPTDEPLTSICVNEVWLAYLRGAAKQLLLQATWRTDDPDALAQVQQQAFGLIDMLQAGSCGSAAVQPNWEPYLYAGHWRNGYLAPGRYHDQPINVFAFTTGAITIRFRDIYDLSDVGGQVLTLFIVTVGSPSVAFQVDWVNCLDQSHSSNHVGQVTNPGWPSEGGPALKSITIAPDEGYVMVQLTTIGNWLCGEA